MDRESNRREFLRNLSLAAATLAAGGGAAAVAGCVRTKGGNDTDKCATIDANGCLLVNDKELAAKLYQLLQQQSTSGKPNTGARLGLCVRFDEPGSPGNKVNSLCDC